MGSLTAVEQEGEQLELALLFSSEPDERDALLSIHAGSGGASDATGQDVLQREHRGQDEDRHQPGDKPQTLPRSPAGRWVAVHTTVRWRKEGAVLLSVLQDGVPAPQKLGWSILRVLAL